MRIWRAAIAALAVVATAPSLAISGAHGGRLTRTPLSRPLAATASDRPSILGPDFNGDGFADLAVGVPLEDLNGQEDAGGVNVLYGSASGITTAGNQFWSQDSPNVDGEAELADQFGSALAAGDFDGDGFADLAVGVPYETLGSANRYAGYVNVLYGSSAGITAANNQHWNQNADGIADTAEPNDLFGFSLAAGDFSGDGWDDLAVGVPFEKVGSSQDAGAANVIYGSPNGLTGQGNQFWNQNSDGIANESEPGDSFGYAITSGDVNGDGHADLMVTVTFEDLGSAADAGGFHVILGSPEGLTAAGTHFWTQNSNGILDTAEADDLFGFSATAADVNGDRLDDVAVGVESEGVGSVADAGAVNVLFGSRTGLTSTGNQFINEDSPDVPSSAEAQDFFGVAVVGADLDGDGFADLAVGAHREDLDGFADAGGVFVLYGSPDGLATAGSELWHQDSPDVKDQDESYDLFGYALAAGNFGSGPEADLAVGVVLEDVSNTADGGAVNLLFGSPSGLTAAGNQYWNQSISGVADGAERGDEFGYAIATSPA